MKSFFRNWRLWLTEGYLVAAMVIASASVGVMFLRLKAERDESAAERTKDVYREAAFALRDGELESRTRKVGDYLVAEGRLGRGSWGYEIAAHGRALVWYREPRAESIKFAYVDTPEYPFWRGGFAAGLAAAALTVALMILLASRHFHSFMKERDDFIAATAHDLRTPIALLSLQTRKSSDDLRNTAMRLRNLVANLTEFLQLGGRRPAPKRERLELAALYREAFGYFREGYEDVECEVSTTGESELFALADGDLVLQIFWNLLGNELKYAAGEGPVAVRFAAERGKALVEFADSGPGMSRTARRRCFDRYYRASTVAETGKGGFGIGLCNAREFARTMGGELTVRANSPRGCVFTLELPLAS